MWTISDICGGPGKNTLIVRTLSAFMLVIAVNFSQAARAAEDVDPLLLDRLNSEAREAWAEYRSNWESAEGTMRFEVFDTVSPTPVYAREHVIKSNSQCISVESYDFSPDKSGTMVLGRALLDGTNPTYAFQLTRESRERGWVMTKGSTDATAASFAMDPFPYYGRSNIEVGIVADANIWLEELLDNGLLRVTALRNKEIDGRELVELRYEVHLGGKSGQAVTPIAISQDSRFSKRIAKFSFRAGTILLDPNRYWVIVSHSGERFLEPNHPTAKEYLIRREYAYLGDAGIPACSGFQEFSTVTNKDGTLAVDDKLTLNLECNFTKANLPDSEFTLTAYGLPELEGLPQQESQRSYFWFWLASTGLTAVILALLVQRWMRKRAAS